MSMSYDEVDREILHWPSDSLLRLRTRINSLLSVGGVTSGQVATKTSGYDESDWLLKIVCEVFEQHGAGSISPSRLCKMRGMPAFNDKLPAIQKYLQRACKQQAGQRAIFRLGVELLYQNLNDMRLPATPQLLMSHIHRLPAVIEKAFPGYAESGLLMLVCDKRSLRRV